MRGTPRSLRHRRSMGPAEGSAAGTSASAAAHDEARLLVVEDEPAILELVSGSLRFAGFDVVTASSGTGVPRAAAECRPDTAGWVAVVLEAVAVITVDRSRPARIKLRSGW